MPGHHGELLENHCVVNRLARILAPRKGSVGVHENSRHGRRINLPHLERFNDHAARLALILALDLFLRHIARAGNLPVEIITVRRTVCRNTAAGLRPDGCPSRMRVNDASGCRESFIELQMRRRVGRRVQIPFDLFTLKVHNHHVGGLQVLIRNTRRFDHEKPLLAVDSGYIAPSEYNQAVFLKSHVGFIDGFFQRLQHINTPSVRKSSGVNTDPEAPRFNSVSRQYHSSEAHF